MAAHRPLERTMKIRIPILASVLTAAPIALLLAGCPTTTSNAENTAATCRNGADDDGDGTSDCLDADCIDFAFCSASSDGGRETNCLNGIDDDGDGASDCVDPDCASACATDGGADTWASELSADQCSDEVDNDHDGRVDCEDVGCAAQPFCICPDRLPVAGRDVHWPLPASLRAGGGWNTLLTSGSGNCMQPSSFVVLGGGDPDARIAETLRFEMVEDASSIRESLSLEASATYDSGIYSADASASYSHDSHVSSYSTYLVLESTVRYAPQTLETFRLSDHALGELRRSPSAFVSMCGDQFVSTVTNGAVFRVVFRFTGLSSSDRREMSASLGGSTGTFSGSAAAASALETLRARYETSITVFRSGAPPEPFTGNLAELIDQGLTFVGDVTRAGVDDMLISLHAARHTISACFEAA
ncbi:MAG: hypothetical protein U0234_33460 [Sandaracinus sp.]